MLISSTPQIPTHPTEDDAALLTLLGEFMQRRNAELKLSVSAVAQRAGLSRATWYRIARGESALPGMRVVRALARVYRVPEAELLALAFASETSGLPSPRPSQPDRQPGDLLWRCHHDHEVRPGGWVVVDLQLLNRSNRPWIGAEVRGVHEHWLPLSGPAPACDPAPCRTALPTTMADHWAQACLTLRAPAVTGRFTYCLALFESGMPTPTGPGTFVCVATSWR